MHLTRALFALTAVAIVVMGLNTLTSESRAQDSIRIAAVVNDHAISVLDVFERMAIVFATANLEDTQETRQRLFPQVLRTLIDERLQLQEGEREGIEISDSELKTAISLVEESIGLQVGQLDAYLSSNRLSRDAIMDELMAELVWNRLVQRRMRSDNITEEEISEILERLEASADERSYLLAEIFLSVDDPQREGEVLANAQRLSESIITGASFPAIARQFSQSASSAAGGDLGWILENQLTDELRAVIPQIAPGNMTEPIRVVGGYVLILVRDRRTGFGDSAATEPPMTMRQAVLPAGAGGDEDELRRQADELSALIASCEGFDTVATSFPQAQVSEPIQIRMVELQPIFADILSDLPTGQTSDPIRTEVGFHVLMICERPEAATTGVPSRQAIYGQLEAEQFDLVSRGYLRDLRREAFVDIRV